MKLVISYEDAEYIVKKFKEYNKLLDGDGLAYLMRRLFEIRGAWIEEGDN